MSHAQQAEFNLQTWFWLTTVNTECTIKLLPINSTAAKHCEEPDQTLQPGSRPNWQPAHPKLASTQMRLAAAGTASLPSTRLAPVRCTVPSIVRVPAIQAYKNERGAHGKVDNEEALRSLVSSQFQYSIRRAALKTTGNPVTDLVYKIQLAWKIFFPEAPSNLSPKDEVKRRLRMVLVADRCGVSPASLAEMKKTIVRALQDFVDIEGEDGIEVAITTEPGLGTVYSVNIPIKRVKADPRTGQGFEGISTDGLTLEWDPNDQDSDPSSRFPMGC